MANERDKDLPLVVAEILIEMQQVRQEIHSMAVLMKKQQEHTTAMFSLLVEEGRKNNEFIAYSLNKALGIQQQKINEHEERLQRLENQSSPSN